MKAAVAIDHYKLDTFEMRLKEAGFNYTILGGLTKGTLILQVNFKPEQAARLTALIKATNAECTARH